MGSQLIVDRWCDLLVGDTLDPEGVVAVGLQLHEGRIKGEQRAYGIDGVWYDVDLCQPCEPRLTMEQLRFLVAQKVALPQRKTKAKGASRRDHEAPAEEGRVSCIWCPGSYSASTAYRKHLGDVHGFADVADAFGDQCPVCPQVAKRLGSHVTKSHREFAHLSAAFMWAKANGDPQGAYAARIAAGKNVEEELVA